LHDDHLQVLLLCRMALARPVVMVVVLHTQMHQVSAAGFIQMLPDLIIIMHVVMHCNACPASCEKL
jgi:hypothetical protein